MQVKSKQRVADFGEVYTNEREVNAMLDLVKDQAQDPDKTFLEPACGTGNFLVAILKRKLDAIAQKHKKIQFDYERNATLALSSLYGIELLADNVNECRTRLLNAFSEHYQSHYPNSYKAECLRSAQIILNKNILCGDALSLKTQEGKEIVFTEWKMVRNQFKRRDYIYRSLLSNEHSTISIEGNESFICEPIKNNYPPVHFLELSND